MLPIKGKIRTRHIAIALALALLGVPASAEAERPTTPELIEQAQQRGEVGPTRATQLRAYALAAPRKLPSKYRSKTPWDGTLTLRRIHGALPKLPRSAARTETAALAGPSAQAVTSCSSSSGNLSSSTDTTHFHVEYNAPPGGGLTVSSYTNSLEATWNTEIGTFEWAAPPLKTAFPGRYYVRIDDINGTPNTTGLYGYVSANGTAAGTYGDNPNTPAWNDGDAYSSCMVLDDDYSKGPPNDFPSTPQNSLDATTAHEFNHSIQYGYGALTGNNQASSSFAEAGASWMEDEVYDAANDNYNYLWPDFRQGLANYDPTFPYPDWIALRGITEPYGTNVRDGGENVMQSFWERTSRAEASPDGTSGNLNSMEGAVADVGGSLPSSYQNYAIAVKFAKACGAGNGSAPPFCFEEGAGYVTPNAGNGPPAAHRSITTVGGTATDTVTDGYAIQWTSLPGGTAPYDVRLQNTSAGGQLRGTVACNPGSGSLLRLQPLAGPLGAGASAVIAAFDPSGCASPVLVTTNSAHSTPNPTSPAPRSMQVSTFAAGTASPPSDGTASQTAAAPTPTLEDLAPALSTPRLSRTRFWASPSRHSRIATRVRYSLSEAARVGFRVERRLRGRWRKSGSFTKSGKAGSNSFRFNGRLRGRKLAPGLYRFVVYARDATGHKSVTRRKSFRILAP